MHNTMRRCTYTKPLMSVPSTVRSVIPVVNWILRISGMDTGRIHIQPATLYPRHSSCFKGDILNCSYEGFCEGYYSVHPRTTQPYVLHNTCLSIIPFRYRSTYYSVDGYSLSNSGLYPRTILDRSRIEIILTKYRV